MFAVRRYAARRYAVSGRNAQLSGVGAPTLPVARHHGMFGLNIMAPAEANALQRLIERCSALRKLGAGLAGALANGVCGVTGPA